MSAFVQDLDHLNLLSIDPGEISVMLDKAIGRQASVLGDADGRLRIDPDSVERDLAKLVLVIVELLRRLMEAQALKRMERGTLNEDEIDRLGEALFKAKAKIEEMRIHFGIAEEDFNIDLGPIGRVL